MLNDEDATSGLTAYELQIMLSRVVDTMGIRNWELGK